MPLPSADADASGISCCPAIFLSAPASGQGKTTITAALARLLKRRGKRVRVFKFGPDYLDPQILALASGEPVVQLDLWMAGEEWCRQQIYNAATSMMADDSSTTTRDGVNGGVILVEGAMGLYDGTPSSADLAAKFGIPVVLVMDVRAMAQTAAAIAVGLKNYRTDFDMIGMIANKCGSNYHGKLVREALPADLPMWAALKREENVELPERHLGLVQPSEDGQEVLMNERIDAGADMLEASGILDQIGQLEPVAFQSQRIEPPPSKALEGVTVAIARDEAFSFAYAANIMLLQDMGASIVYFSPTHDTTIPPEATALWLPGGYPELHAKALSENSRMISSLRRFHEHDNPILAECGGFLYCMETLVDLHGTEWAMSSLMPGKGAMKNKAG